MRSLLVVPGGSAGAFEAALASGADALLLDLERTVPAPGKDAARAAVAAALARMSGTRDRPRLFVRISGLGTGLADRDLDAVMPGRPDGILLPNTVGAADVAHLGAKLAVHEAEHGWPDGGTAILALATGTARGVFGLGSLQGAGRRLAGIAWDSQALAADLGTAATLDRGLYDLVRSLTLLAAAAAGVAAIDAASGDPDDLAACCANAVRDGFSGKLALHPGQVPVINAAFGPGRRSRA